MSKKAMKLALEALEVDPFEMVEDADGHMVFLTNEAITALREALAEQPAQQEPVAFIKGRGWRNGNLEVIPAKMNQTFEIDQPLYTSPPAQRTWVGLTDEEIQTIWRSSEHMNEAEVCRAIEAKLKEKNNA